MKTVSMGYNSARSAGPGQRNVDRCHRRPEPRRRLAQTLGGLTGLLILSLLAGIGSGPVSAQVPTVRSPSVARAVLERLREAVLNEPALIRDEVARQPLFLAFTRHHMGASPMVVHHGAYQWPDGSARVDVHVIQGGGRDSISVVTPSSGWLLVDGHRVQLERGELSRRIDTFLPDRLYRFHLSPLPFLTMLLAEGTELQSEGRVGVDGAHRIRISKGARGVPVRALEVDEDELRITGVAFEGGSGLRWVRYRDFRPGLPGLELPFVIEHEGPGGVEDRIQVERISVLGVNAEMLTAADRVKPPARRGGTSN